MYNKKIINILNLDNDKIKFIEEFSKSKNYLIYEDLYNKNYFVLPGGKFGALFLIYDKDPFTEHAKALIFNDKNVNLIEMNRAATVVNK